MELKRIELLSPDIYMEIFPLLQKGVVRLNDDNTIQNIIWDIKTDKKQLWACYRANKIVTIIITSLIDYPKGRRLLYYLVSGAYIDLCLKRKHIIDDWARENGCVVSEFFGRPGWKKKLEKLGYNLDYICMSKQL